MTKNVKSHIKWDFYTRLVEDKRFYLLYYGKDNFTIIPKRVLKNIAQRQIFDRIIQGNLKKSAPNKTASKQ